MSIVLTSDIHSISKNRSLKLYMLAIELNILSISNQMRK